MAELLVWPVLLAYGEATVAYAGELRGIRRGGSLGIWGVRIGWIAQTALLLDQALTSDGFPWGTWAAALNLLSWLVVSAYLVWGCRPRYRLLGLAVMPVALALLALAWAGGGTGVENGDRSAGILAVHVALVLASFATFTLVAAVAGLYLWEERQLKRRDASLLSLRIPPLEALDRLSSRLALIGLALLTGGVAMGVARLHRGDLDLTVGVTVVVWAAFAATLALGHEGVLQGRRLARAYLAAFALVAVVLPLTHFAA
jgi:ABC-type uncharacterized transport system permease subunit